MDTAEIKELVNEQAEIIKKIDCLRAREWEINREIVSLRQRDVTAECHVEYRKSKQCDGDGYYIALVHNNHDVAVFGVDGPRFGSGYQVRLAKHAAPISFRVTKDP